MNLIIDTELKQNSELFVNNVRSIISPSREVFWETRVLDSYVQGERTQLFLCPGYSNITKWVHQLPTLKVKIRYFQQLLWKVSIPIKDR